MEKIKIKTTYFEFFAFIQLSRQDYIKKIIIQKEHYKIILNGIEIIEFKALLEAFTRGALKKKKTKLYEILFFEEETKIKIQEIMFNMLEVLILKEILFNLSKKYPLIEI